MTFGRILGEDLTMAASAMSFYIANDNKNKTKGKLAASNINIKIHQLFSKQCILVVHVTTVQRKIFGDLTRTCF